MTDFPETNIHDGFLRDENLFPRFRRQTFMTDFQNRTFMTDFPETNIYNRGFEDEHL